VSSRVRARVPTPRIPSWVTRWITGHGSDRASADARDAAAVVRDLMRRGEPLILVALSLHVTAYGLTQLDAPLIVVAAILGQVAGALSLVWPGDRFWPMARAAAATTLLLTISLHLADDRLIVVLPWFSIIPISYCVALGLRRAWPLVVLITIPQAVVILATFGSPWSLALRVAPTVIGALVAGLISDVMSDAVLAARNAVDRERRLRTSVDTAPIGIITIDIDGRATLVNALITDFLQVTGPPEHLDDFLVHVHHGDTHLVDELRSAVIEGRPVRRNMRVVHPALGLRTIRVISAPMVDDHGVLIGSAITLQDIHEDLDNRRKLEQFRTIADSTSDIIGVASLRPQADYLNPAGRHFFGVERISLSEIADFIPVEYHRLLFREVFKVVRHGGSWSGEIEVFDRHRIRRPASAVVMGLFDETDELEAFAVIYRDIEERKALESRLAFEAGHDLLTGLPNRQQLFHTLSETLAAGDPVAVLFGDLDGFKLVNDSLGHYVGDTLLMSVAARLVDSARANDLVGRLGGDEFVVVCREELTAEGAAAIAQRFIEVVRQPVEIDGREHVVSMSMGIAIGGAGISASELVQQADLAMYAAKRTGRRRVAVFDREMRVHADERLELEADLRSAITNSEIELHYQPIVNTLSGDVLGFESLARWNHPTRGLLQPKEFMPVVESAGFARTFGEYVVREASHTAAMMRLVAPRLTMSVNMSRHQLNDHRLVDVVAEALAAAHLPASALSIEITEEMVMDELNAAQPRLDALRALGVRFAIDDFGTGYSNLSMLKQFSADYVKIDRSLIEGEHELMELVLSLTRELGFAAIAEGVETAEQLEHLRAYGCHHAQGYYFATPMSTAEAMSYLAARFPPLPAHAAAPPIEPSEG
jgi:diguanylate cyclase (GGDEF)-like protein/PAS domain S-box-containing protein